VSLHTGVFDENVHEEPADDAYDVVVIGSGLGGLSAAGLLAKAGKKVLLAERHHRPGGYVHGFERDDYVFDSAVHLLSAEGGLAQGVLTLLGADDACSLIRVDPFYTAVFPDFRIEVPLGVDAYVEAHARHFPEQEGPLRALIDVCFQIPEEMRRVPTEPGLMDLVRFPRNCPQLFRYRNATVGDLCDKFLTNDRVKSLFGAVWPYMGLPPSRLSLLGYAMMWTSYIDGGTLYCRGGFQQLANAYVTGLERNGGELVLGREVEQIVVEDGRVAGVVLDGGDRISASAVVSNAAAEQTLERLLGPEHLPRRYLKKLHDLRLSQSCFVLYLVTDFDLHELEGATHEMFVYPDWNFDNVYEQLLAGEPTSVGITMPSLHDPSLAPEGESVLTVITLLPFEQATSWQKGSEPYVEKLLQVLYRAFPQLDGRITFLERASPRTLERFTGNPNGAAYGWDMTPDQMGRNRPDHRTPVEGLFLSGHWTQPGAGAGGVIVSGVQTAQLVLGYKTMGDFLEGMNYEDAVAGAQAAVAG
jgi:phytoene desaturase